MNGVAGRSVAAADSRGLLALYVGIQALLLADAHVTWHEGIGIRSVLIEDGMPKRFSVMFEVIMVLQVGLMLSDCSSSDMRPWHAEAYRIFACDIRCQRRWIDGSVFSPAINPSRH